MPLDPGRREFLSHSAMLLSVLAISACGGGGNGSNAIVTPPVQPPLPNSGDTPGALSPTTDIQKIIILGGGMSGLVAAYELRRAGHDVTVLEARQRLGGRVHTLSAPFSDGQFAEAGASRIPSNHDLTLAYATHFGLIMDPFYADSGHYVSLQDTSRTLIDANDYIIQPPWPGSVNCSAYSKIRGGMSQLPMAFARDLEDIIFLNSVVESVEQSNEQVVISTEDGQLHTADMLLCTVPLPVLNNITFNPALSSQKTAAANGAYTYSPSTRVYSQFEQRFWQNDGLNGWGETNRPEEIWQPTWDDPGSKGIVLSYLRGFAAQQFDLLSAQQQLNSVLDSWQLAFPGAS